MSTTTDTDAADKAPDFSPQTPAEQAEWILASAKRLVTFTRMNVPAIIIEAERMILLRKLIAFPVDPEAQASHQQIDAELRHSEQAHLVKAGFYDDVVGDAKRMDGGGA